MQRQEPIVEYPNMQVMHPDTKVAATGVGTTVVGGRIYRSSAMPELQGKLVFADWSADFKRPSGQLFLATPASRWRDLWSFEKVELDTRGHQRRRRRQGRTLCPHEGRAWSLRRDGQDFQDRAVRRLGKCLRHLASNVIGKSARAFSNSIGSNRRF